MTRTTLTRLLLWSVGSIAVACLLWLSFTRPIIQLSAQDCTQISCNRGEGEDQYLDCIKEKQICLEAKIKETRSTAASLNSTISILNGQISLQELQIDQTQTEISVLEREIGELNTRIAGLEVSLDQLSNILVKRVQESYKRQRTVPSSLTLLSQTESIGGLIKGQEYLQRAETQISQAMARAETQRLTYDQQKALKESKQLEVEEKRVLLESQQAELAQQKTAHQQLLSETKSSEARYQAELAKTKAELDAIQSIIAGRGDESNAGSVSKGDTIAQIIAGASTCSTGSHLHFEVVKDNTHRDPAGYLKSIDASWNNQPDSSFAFIGDWDWPVNNPAKINQGYGMTYYASVRRAYGGAPHTGIDMFSKTGGDYSVKAVQPGTLYRGSIPCGGGLLRYVKVDHQDSPYSTYYLHVNY